MRSTPASTLQAGLLQWASTSLPAANDGLVQGCVYKFAAH